MNVSLKATVHARLMGVDSELLMLAMNRYPGVEPQLAYMQFCSDRHYAGLGALAGRDVKAYDPRRCSIQPNNRKYSQFNSRAVIWRIGRYANFVEAAKAPTPMVSSRRMTFESITMTTRHIQINLEIKVARDIREIQTQIDRRALAADLRGARAALRDAVNESLAQQRSN